MPYSAPPPTANPLTRFHSSHVKNAGLVVFVRARRKAWEAVTQPPVTYARKSPLGPNAYPIRARTLSKSRILEPQARLVDMHELARTPKCSKASSISDHWPSPSMPITHRVPGTCQL